MNYKLQSKFLLLQKTIHLLLLGGGKHQSTRWSSCNKTSTTTIWITETNHSYNWVSLLQIHLPIQIRLPDWTISTEYSRRILMPFMLVDEIRIDFLHYQRIRLPDSKYSSSLSLFDPYIWCTRYILQYDHRLLYIIY